MTEVNTMDNGDLQGNIAVPNRAVNNQTTLICVAKNVHPPEVYSSEVVLQLLAQVSVIAADSTTTTSNSALKTTATASLSSAAALTSTVVIFMITLCVSIIILLVL